MHPVVGVSFLISVTSAGYYNDNDNDNDGWTSLLESSRHSQHDSDNQWQLSSHRPHWNYQSPQSNYQWTSLSSHNDNDDRFSSYFNEDNTETDRRHSRFTRRVDNDTVDI